VACGHGSTWPIDEERLAAYLEKATREAKLRTTWTEPNREYDEAVRVFVHAVLVDPVITSGVASFVDRIAPAWRSNVLAQKLLAHTIPGVPDIYQGCDLTDLSLVDPDNRRPVDYGARRDRLARLDAGEAPRDLDDEKLLVVSRSLRLRQARPEWFGAGSTYEALPCTSRQAVAFVRSGEVVTVAARLSLGLSGEGDDNVALPEGEWQDLLTGSTYEGRSRIGDLLGELPVALLVRVNQEGLVLSP